MGLPHIPHCCEIWGAILNAEEEKPAIGGIPQSLRDRLAMLKMS
jgi:hypothetical protein